MSHIDIEKHAVLSVVPTPNRLQIVLRRPSGEAFMAWSNMPPYLRLGDLGIPGAPASYTVLKQSDILEDHARMWREGSRKG